MVQVGNDVVMLPFILCFTLTAPVVLVCDYCDIFTETVRPISREIELEDGNTHSTCYTLTLAAICFHCASASFTGI